MKKTPKPKKSSLLHRSKFSPQKSKLTKAEMKVINATSIRCDRCKRPVDETRVHQDNARRKLIVTVKCHGQEETSELDIAELSTCYIVSATAFKTPLLRE